MFITFGAITYACTKFIHFSNENEIAFTYLQGNVPCYITKGDLFYFNGCNFALMLGLLGVFFIIRTLVYADPDCRVIAIIKYQIIALELFCFIRFIFEFTTYDKLTSTEVGIDLMLLILVILRFINWNSHHARPVK